MTPFLTRVRARYCETDAAGVVYYGSFFHYFEVGKMEMFRELALPYRYDIPILETHCTACHGESRRKGGLALHDPASIDITEQAVDASSSLTLRLAPGGGQAIRIRPAE